MGPETLPFCIPGASHRAGAQYNVLHETREDAIACISKVHRMLTLLKIDRKVVKCTSRFLF